MVRVFAHGAMGRRIDPSWGEPIELFLVPAKGARCSSMVRAFIMVRWVIGSILHGGPGARCSSVVRAFAHGAMGHQIDPSWGGPIELL